MIYGGFPKSLEFDSVDSKLIYFNDLDETIVINDLINRYKIRNIELFKALVNFILTSNSRVISAKSITNYLSKNFEKVSINTVMNYIGYLKEACIIDSISLYDKKRKKELSYYQKIYDTDVCFNSIRVFDNKFDLTHNLENIVYNELLYMGYKLFCYNNNGREVDFLAIKGNYKYFIQVTYTLVDDSIYDREFKAFNSLDPQVKRIIISNDFINYSTSLVRHIKLSDFLLLNNLEN